MLVGAPGGSKGTAHRRVRRWNRCRARAEASARRLRTGYAAHGTQVRRLAVRAGAGIAVTGLVLGWLLWGSDVTRVQEVTVTVLDPRAPSIGQPLDDGTVQSRTDQILARLDIPMDEPLVNVDTSAVSRQVQSMKRYSNVVVERGWPSRVDITVTPRVPVLAVLDAAGGVQLLDGDGVAFEQADAIPRGVPTAALSGGTQAAARTAVAAILALPGPRRQQVRELEVDPAGSVELQVGDVRVQWGGQGDERLKAAVVDALVDSPGIDRIDVSVPRRPVTTNGD